MKPQDKVRNYFTVVTTGSKKSWKCKYCHKEYTTENTTRFKEHLKSCMTAPASIRTEYKDIDTHKPKGHKVAVSSIETEETLDEKPSCSSHESSETPEPPTKTVKLTKFVDNISVEESAHLDKLLGQFIFAEGLPFQLVESSFLKRFLNAARPSYSPPSRRTVAGPILDREAAEADANRSEKFQKATVLSVLSDGWNSCDVRSFINFIVTCPEPIFFKSIDTGKRKKAQEPDEMIH